MNNKNLIPFIFGVISTEGQAAINSGGDAEPFQWAVKISHPDFRIYKSEWMDDKILGNICLIPDVNITEEMHEPFYNF